MSTPFGRLNASGKVSAETDSRAGLLFGEASFNELTFDIRQVRLQQARIAMDVGTVSPNASQISSSILDAPEAVAISTKRYSGEHVIDQRAACHCISEAVRQAETMLGIIPSPS
ncbi:hypothetical protein XH88_08940 [Bradyrhizobium sp. CCBAU 51627]|nr:hypothetical protein [Bradyrhizobium sp. CCBAU 51627]